MASRLIFFILLIIPLQLSCNSNPETWIRAGYWYYDSGHDIADINSALFTHLFCSFAYFNSTTFKISINSSTESSFSTFTTTVRRRNPKISTILSIWLGKFDSDLINRSSNLISFINSSIHSARVYGFDGIGLYGSSPNSTNFGTLLAEFRSAVDSDSTNSGKPPLILVMSGNRVPSLDSVKYPIKSMKKNLDWVHLSSYDYIVPTRDNVTAPHAALYDPSGKANTDEGIKVWLKEGFSTSKLVLGLPFHGYAWTVASGDNGDGVGLVSSGPAITQDGSFGYKMIKSLCGDLSVYNSTYVVNFCKIGRAWINFDDVEAVKAKVSYAKEKGMLGYCVFQLGNDWNWALSRAAASGNGKGRLKKKQLVIIILVSVLMMVCLIGAFLCYLQRRVLKSKGMLFVVKNYIPGFGAKTLADTDENNGESAPSLQVFSFSRIKAATKNFSSQNKLGEGGFGPVYKGSLEKGRDIAVKRLSKTSNQGHEEFKNEVTLTAKLQHVNLVRVLGICTERQENMLVYEYMPNGSLDFYLFDPDRKKLLDWEKRVHIIEGVIQGLLYLQEYSNVTIIHRDLKSSNILLDADMNAKISDFGVARFFRKDELEANTGRIVGTYGYVPPEYVKKGIYSMKYDVYSFGVLLLQIISGKKNSSLYGYDENLNLLEYAYELWRGGRMLEFFDPSLDDSLSSCKLTRCLQVALLCVQEDSVDRPSMLEVYTMLKNEGVAINTPKQPAFAIHKDGNEERDFLSRDQLYSVNDASVTELVPR